MPMLPDYAPNAASKWMGSKRALSTFALVLGLGVAGCESEVGIGATDLFALCLEKYHGNPGCCLSGYHVDHETCCPDHTHLVRDFEHPDWYLCQLDIDASADAGSDADADAP